MTGEKQFLNVSDICKAMECSESKGYSIIRQLNKELNEKGCITISGKVYAKYFYERIYDGQKT